MISVDEALSRTFGLIQVLPNETIPLAEAADRVLARGVVAGRDQPPFASSAMDGYAVRSDDAAPGATLNVIGTAAAGHRFNGTVGAAQAVRIFTGAPVPDGADRVVMQEDVTRQDERITLNQNPSDARFIRGAGADFVKGAEIPAPRLLGANDLALLASMNIAEVAVSRRPVVAFIATGDELVMPGEVPGQDQIIASNTFGLSALARGAGAEVRSLPIARDTVASLTEVFALAADADLIVTIGGASVGDHDLVGPVAESLGLERSFYKVAMRPGKPLMAGRMNDNVLLGLPGNPVSSMVCGHVFMLPLLRAMQGLGHHPAPRKSAILAATLPANGPREHYMRAQLEDGQIDPADRQDSALLTVLAGANALLVRPANDPERAIGDRVGYIEI